MTLWPKCSTRCCPRAQRLPSGSPRATLRRLPSASFLAVSDAPPDGANPRVRFDRGRVVVADRAGRKLLDLGGFTTGAVAQIVTVADHPGLWIKPLATDGTLPAPDALKLDHGDVAFLDQQWRGARDVDRTRHAGPDYLSGPGVVADRRRALSLLDRRRPVADRDRGLPVRAAADIPQAAGRRERIACRSRHPIARWAIFWSAAASSRWPQLDEAVALAERWNVRLGDALLARNWIEPRLYYEAYAQNFDLPFVDLLDEPPDRALLSADDVDIYAHRLTMPWRRRDGRLVIATAEPGPETLLFARQRWGTAIEFVVVSKFDIIFAIQTAFADALSHRAVS